MDDFNDFYNRFIASQYGVNVLNYLFFIAAFFVVILFGVLIVLVRTQKDDTNIKKEFSSSKYYKNGYNQSTKY